MPALTTALGANAITAASARLGDATSRFSRSFLLSTFTRPFAS